MIEGWLFVLEYLTGYPVTLQSLIAEQLYSGQMRSEKFELRQFAAANSIICFELEQLPQLNFEGNHRYSRLA